MQVFLDLDGTILDIKKRCYQIYYDFLTQEGFPCLDIDDYWYLKRKKMPEATIAAATADDDFAISYEKDRVMVLEHMQYLILDEIFRGVRTRLKDWMTWHQLTLITKRKNKENLEKQLDFFDLTQYFTNILSTTEPKEALLKKLIDNPERAVIIGDTETDILAGKAVNIQTIAVTSGIRNADILVMLEPNLITRNLREVLL